MPETADIRTIRTILTDITRSSSADYSRAKAYEALKQIGADRTTPEPSKRKCIQTVNVYGFPIGCCTGEGWHEAPEENVCGVSDNAKRYCSHHEPLYAEPCDASTFVHSMDARDWTAGWLKCVAANPSIATDEGAMLGWFANAIMAGFDTARRRYESTPTPPPEPPATDAPRADAVKITFVERFIKEAGRYDASEDGVYGKIGRGIQMLHEADAALADAEQRAKEAEANAEFKWLTMERAAADAALTRKLATVQTTANNALVAFDAVVEPSSERGAWLYEQIGAPMEDLRMTLAAIDAPAVEWKLDDFIGATCGICHARPSTRTATDEHKVRYLICDDCETERLRARGDLDPGAGDFEPPPDSATPAHHVYLSTACHHGKHAECRQKCKFCGTTCACPCHRADYGAEVIDARTDPDAYAAKTDDPVVAATPEPANAQGSECPDGEFCADASMHASPMPSSPPPFTAEEAREHADKLTALPESDVEIDLACRLVATLRRYAALLNRDDALEKAAMLTWDAFAAFRSTIAIEDRDVRFGALQRAAENLRAVLLAQRAKGKQ